MKMFTRAFAPFFHPRGEEAAFTTSVGGKTAVAMHAQDRAATSRPVRIDVEQAVAVMLAASDVKDESLRRKFRLDVLKTLPSKSIDWETVDWVQVWPFQTARL